MIKLKKKVKGYVENYLKQVNDDGFSLLELVVAVGILLILTVGGLLAYNGLTRNARVAAVQSAADEVLTGAVAADVQGKSKEEIEDVGDEWTNTGKGVITTTVDASDRTCIVVEAVHKEHKDIKSIRGTGNGCEYDNDGNLITTPGDNSGGDDTGGSENGDDDHDNKSNVELNTSSTFGDDAWGSAGSLDFTIDADKLTPTDQVYAGIGVRASGNTSVSLSGVIEDLDSFGDNLTYGVVKFDPSTNSCSPGSSYYGVEVVAPGSKLSDAGVISVGSDPVFLCITLTAGEDLKQNQSTDVRFDFVSTSGSGAPVVVSASTVIGSDLLPSATLAKACTYYPGLAGVGTQIRIYWNLPAGYTLDDVVVKSSTNGLGSETSELIGFSLRGKTTRQADGSYRTDVPTNLLGSSIGNGSELEVSLVVATEHWESEPASVATNGGLTAGVGGTCRNLP